MNRLRLYHLIDGLRFLSLAKVGLNISLITQNPSQGWRCDTKPCEGCTACCEELESTFTRDRNPQTVISWNSCQSAPSLRKPDCHNHGGGVGATQSTSERQSKNTSGRPVPVERYPEGIATASIFPLRPVINATGRPGLSVKSTVYKILGRPYQTKTKTQAQIRNLGNAHGGF